MKLVTAMFLALLVSACGSFPVNPKLEKFGKDVGYRFEALEPGPKNTDSLFVIVTMSGGGTRAAALSYGVLEALGDTRIRWQGVDKTLLEEVDIISSVSGGSFTAAYYALHRDETFNGRFEDIFLKRDVEKDLVKRLFIPSSWFKLAGSSYGRSDLSAEYYDKYIFQGAKYGDLIKEGKRPFVIVNATDMTLGAQFPFIQDQFDLICSDLASLPVARAVASSSAFPGALTPLTFESYANQCEFSEYRWVSLAEDDRRENAERTIRADQRRSYYDIAPPEPGSRQFVHLIDGGVADNIGLRGPAYAIGSTDPTYSVLRRINNEAVDKVVVIVVNAATQPATERDQSPAVPGLVDVVTSAATVPLDNYSADTVALLKAKVKEFNAGYDHLRDCEAVLQEECPGSKLDAGLLHPVDLYVVEVAFDYLADADERRRFKNIRTSFSLPADTVDALKRIGCTLYRDDPALTDLLDGKGRTQQKVNGRKPECRN